MDRETYVVVTRVLLKRRWPADAEVLLRDPPIFRQSQLSPLSLSRQPCLKLKMQLCLENLFLQELWVESRSFFGFLLVGLETPGILPVLWQSRIWEERASWTSLELYLDSRGNKTTAVETTTPVPPATAVETTTPVPPAAFSLEVRLEMAEIVWELLFFWVVGNGTQDPRNFVFVALMFAKSVSSLIHSSPGKTPTIPMTAMLPIKLPACRGYSRRGQRFKGTRIRANGKSYWTYSFNG